MTKINFGLTIKNKALLGCGDFHHTYSIDNTGKRKNALIDTLRFERIPTVKFKANVSKTAHILTVNLSHRLTGQVIVKNDVKVQPQIEDMLQPPTADGQHVNNVNICQHPHSVVMPFTPMGEIETIKHLQTFPQIEEVPKADQTITFDNNLLRKYRSALRARTGRETHLKDKKVIAKEGLNNYPSRALSKISKLALVGYDSLAYTVRLMDFFCMRNTSMRSHIAMAKLEGDTFECAGDLESQSTNPFQFCHPYLVVNGRTSNSLGVHTHA